MKTTRKVFCRTLSAGTVGAALCPARLFGQTAAGAGGGGATGWHAPATTPWFEQALNEASQAHFGASCGYIGQGGTIPLMNMLSEGFPKAQMMVCGVLGPKSNAHGPNEFLHVPYAKRLTASVAQVIGAMARQAATA